MEFFATHKHQVLDEGCIVYNQQLNNSQYDFGSREILMRVNKDVQCISVSNRQFLAEFMAGEIMWV